MVGFKVITDFLVEEIVYQWEVGCVWRALVGGVEGEQGGVAIVLVRIGTGRIGDSWSEGNQTGPR